MPSRSKKPTKSSSSKPSAKKTTKKSTLALNRNLSLALAAIIVLTVGFAAGKNHHKAEKEGTSYLFIQQAVTGSLRPAVTGSGHTLTLIGIKPHTLLFSDRPSRMVGSWTMTDFVTRWNQGKDSFAGDPPNAVLMSHSTVDGKEYAIAVELNNPVFNGPGGWVTYDAKILGETSPDDLTISNDRYMGDFPEILRSPALFIDNSFWGTGI